MNTIRYWYFELLRRGLPKWVIAIAILAIGIGSFAVVLALTLATNGLALFVMVCILVSGLLIVVITSTLPDDPRKKKGES